MITSRIQWNKISFQHTCGRNGHIEELHISHLGSFCIGGYCEPCGCYFLVKYELIDLITGLVTKEEKKENLNQKGGELFV